MIGGLEANDSHDKFKLVGSITHSSGESVGSAAVATPTGSMEADKISSQARAVREQMARHISEGTLSNDADQLVSKGRELHGVMTSLLSETDAVGAALEDAYLLGDASYAEVQEAERQGTVLREELALWQVVVPVPSG